MSDLDARKRGAKLMAEELAKLKKQNGELFADAVAARREAQLADARVAQYDRLALVKAMKEGAFITWPEDEPALGVKAGETFQKRDGKLVQVTEPKMFGLTKSAVPVTSADGRSTLKTPDINEAIKKSKEAK